ncbi:methylated-DNA--[protein]-cysteine S-methyltransferase [Gordonia sp. HY285]|uniref:Methylated-DNA--protein-cysteine methyltransferase n=1 Tax=Gordonia liuliyuniae TaxID=2911517 RepID=A0ABS9IQ44_9ACTN|nr:methylated-DNA--[protein]-cysteine S-methyltransferase [Gordonia liuliyuniae]MCF8587650.1 methylated-DNA--[protein]-cysteine S-methyltransferase [Gordonia liuliyuniae]MCF8610355.1 methylated-DNA--[protein]-cysteine S-methyltransferase [Gordonia liuliyuniae]
MLRHTVLPTPVDDLLLVADGDALIRVVFADHTVSKSARGPEAADDDAVLQAATQQLIEYFDRSRTVFDLPLRTDGNEFDTAVWRALVDIEYGTTVTYGELAGRLGDPRFAQRIGQSVGRNPIAVVLPCHRVVGADGTLTGFGGGLERKRILLDLEEPPADVGMRLF